MAAMREEFIAFCDQQYKPLLQFLMNAGASFPQAQDAAQDSFGDGWELVRSGAWAQVRNPPGWIRTVGLRRYYRYRDRASREVPVLDLADAPQPGPCPAELAEQTLTVMNLLHSLPVRERVALAFQIDGFSCRETAAYLGLTEQDVQNLRKKARKTIDKLDQINPARRRPR